MKEIDLENLYIQDSNIFPPVETKKTSSCSSPWSTQSLTKPQLQRLANVLEDIYYIHGCGNFPTLSVPSKRAVLDIQEKLLEANVSIKDVRFNGSVAGYVLSDLENKRHNDLDIVFLLDFSPEEADHKFNIIREVVLECLLNWFPEHYKNSFTTKAVISKAYVQKMCKVTNSSSDSWSLITLKNNFSRNLELKFVKYMKRQFEFSMDSFQIILNNHITSEGILLPASGDDAVVFTEEPFPCSLLAESVWGNFEEALSHLNKRLICIKNPEEVRGGGLLKYCNLLAQSYKHENSESSFVEKLESYMVNRFFIDFCKSDVNLYRTIVGYLETHFGNDPKLGVLYLKKLYNTIDSSKVNEKSMALRMISYLKTFTEHQLQVLYNNNFPPKFGSELDSVGAMHYQFPVLYPKWEQCSDKLMYPLFNVAYDTSVIFSVPTKHFKKTYPLLDSHQLQQE